MPLAGAEQAVHEEPQELTDRLSAQVLPQT
jgi:hypothetical protein